MIKAIMLYFFFLNSTVNITCKIKMVLTYKCSCNYVLIHYKIAHICYVDLQMLYQ